MSHDIYCRHPCPNTCRQVFDRVHVSYLIRGGTYVLWDLLPDFLDPLPYTFQLQVGQTANNDATDWEDVGLPIENTFYAVDGEQRSFGQIPRTHYRVKLTTIVGEYYSEPTGSLGILNHRDWRVAREIVRKEKLRFRLDTHEGYLLKRRRSGPKCPQCIDLQLDESADANCPVCYGTRFQCGYFYPLGCIWADISPKTHRTAIDLQRGATSVVTVPARMLMLPLIDTYDVWVDRATDDRYYIHTIQHVAELKGVPIVAHVELRLAPFSDAIYNLEIPDQVLTE